MKCLLLALTGAGNEVMYALKKHIFISALHVITREEIGNFPYYPCPHLAIACRNACVSCTQVSSKAKAKDIEDIVTTFKPSLLICATFHIILTPNLLAIPRWAVNMHPSLLPAYKGTTPTNWAIAFGEEYSGITWHTLTSQIDSGIHIMQRKVPISGLTDGELRKRLYSLAGESIADLIEILASSTLKFSSQTTETESSFPSFFSSQAERIKKDIPQHLLDLASTPYRGNNHFSA